MKYANSKLFNETIIDFDVTQETLDLLSDVRALQSKHGANIDCEFNGEIVITNSMFQVYKVSVVICDDGGVYSDGINPVDYGKYDNLNKDAILTRIQDFSGIEVLK